MPRILPFTLTLAVLPSLALAHTSFVEPAATAGIAFKATLAVPHGCDGKPSTEIRIKLPEGFIAAQPMPKPGWSLEVIEGDYASTYSHHGQPLTSGPIEIRWTGGRLDDACYDEFTVRGTFGNGVASGSVAFPVTQVCEGGTIIAWDEIATDGQDPHELRHPAPTIAVTAADAAGGHAGHRDAGDATAGASAAPGAAHAGMLELSGGFVRAMLPGQSVGGGYVTITNNGTETDRLVAMTSTAASSVEAHRMQMDGDVMRMRPMPEGIEIPAGGTVRLAPGGDHLMFNGVADPFRENGTITVELDFEKAGRVEITLPILGSGAKAADPVKGDEHGG